MVQLQGSAVASSTTFSNPVYEMEDSSDTQFMPSSSAATTLCETSSISSSQTHSFASVDIKPEPSSSVIGDLHFNNALVCLTLANLRFFDAKSYFTRLFVSAPQSDLRPSAPKPPRRTLKEGKDKMIFVSGNDESTDV